MASISIDRNGFLANVFLARKGPCRAATTAAITLSGEQTIDGVSVVAEDRVLVKDQSSAVDNGIYICKTSEWERSDDFNQRGHADKGTTVLVTDGTTNALTEWYVTTTGDPVPGQESISFSLYSNSTLAALVATRGDIIRGGATDWERLALGTSGYHLSSDGTDAAWAGFTQAGTGAVTRAWLNKNRWLIDAEDYGATGDGSTDDAAKIQAAIDHVNSVGGGEVRFEAAEYALSTNLTQRSGVRLVGKGSGNTILKLKTNANTPVFKTLDYDTLHGGATAAGPSDWGVIGLTLDGNSTNQSAASGTLDGMSVYGYRFLIEDVVLRDCKGHGWRSDWAQFGEFAMEATIRRLKIDTCGRHGFWFEGPHDSFGEDIIIIDAGQETDDTYDGFLLTGFGTGRWVNIHPWHRSTATNRMLSSARIETSANDFISPHLEGGRQCLIQRGDRNKYKGAFIFAGFSTDPLAVIRGNHLLFEAHIEDSVPSGASCLQIGESGVGGLFFSHLDVLAITSATNAIIISDDDGRNTGVIKTVGATNAYSGSWASNSSVLVQNPDGTFEDRGTTTHNGKRTFNSDDATNNAVTYVERLTHTTSGTPANGIGVGVEFEVETSAGNNEVGATIEAVTEDVTSTSEDFSVVVKTMRAGAAAEERVRIGFANGGFAAAIRSTDTNTLQCLSTGALGSASGAGIQAHAGSIPSSADQRLGFYTFGAYDGSNRNGGAIVGHSDAAWTAGTDHPTRISFETAPDGSATRVERFRVDSKGNVISPYNTAALSTAATDGLLYVPTSTAASTAAPIGTPTSYTGMVPLLYNTSQNRLWIYNGAWRSVALTT